MASQRASTRLVALLAFPSRRSAQPSSRAHQQFTRFQPQRTLRTFVATAPTYQQSSSSSPIPEGDLAVSSESQPLRSLTNGLDDPPPFLSEDERQVDWTRSYHGLSAAPFTPEQAEILQQELDFDDIEIKPDGIVYLPEIKYRRVLNKAFGPGGWGLAPRGETIVTGKTVTREYGLVCGGRLVSIARGEQQYFDPEGIPTATEGCKSNALMRCCKDLGIASELWDPRFIRKFLRENAREIVVEHQTTKKRRKHWMRRDDELRWPFKEVDVPGSAASTPKPAATSTPTRPASTPAARPTTNATKPVYAPRK